MVELGTGPYAHTQGVILGWLGNVFFASLYHAVPILSGRRVTSTLLGRWLFALWNLAVMVPGWILVLAGFSQPLEWAQFPPIIDIAVVSGLVLAAIQFVPPFFRRGVESLCVSRWYVVGASSSRCHIRRSRRARPCVGAPPACSFQPTRV